MSKAKIAKRLAQELQEGQVVNLGIGIPTLVVDYIGDKQVFLQSENGLLGVGPTPSAGEEDADLIGASRNPVTLNKGGSVFDSPASFAMIRGGHIDVAVLGVLEVDETGEIANWAVPGQSILGVGGSMDLVAGAKSIYVGLLHLDKSGKPKLVKQLTCPSSGARKVNKIVTEHAVFEIVNGKMMLMEYNPSLSIDQLREMTDARFEVSPDVKANYI